MRRIREPTLPVWCFTPVIPALRKLWQEDHQPELHSDTLSQKTNKQTNKKQIRHRWLMPVKLATQKTEIKKMVNSL
jgi:hypothetical protein